MADSQGRTGASSEKSERTHLGVWSLNTLLNYAVRLLWVLIGAGILISTLWSRSNGYAITDTGAQAAIIEVGASYQRAHPDKPVIPIAIRVISVDPQTLSAKISVSADLSGARDALDYVENKKSVLVKPIYGDKQIASHYLTLWYASSANIKIPLALSSDLNESPAITATIPLVQGAKYPFDSYNIEFPYAFDLNYGVDIKWKGDVQSAVNAKAFVKWYSSDREFTIYSSSIVIPEVTQSADFPIQSAYFKRHPYDIVEQVLLSLLPGLLILVSFINRRGTERGLQLELGVGFIAVLSLRQILVPSDIRQFTYIDSILTFEVFAMVGVAIWQWPAAAFRKAGVYHLAAAEQPPSARGPLIKLARRASRIGSTRRPRSMD